MQGRCAVDREFVNSYILGLTVFLRPPDSRTSSPPPSPLPHSFLSRTPPFRDSPISSLPAASKMLFKYI